jgi:glycine/D-amino acid oxidase-like deaminating enzyme
VTEPEFDIFVIGGGINGCGIARDAAGRGYKVALAEMNDFGSGTSSGSTKLVHGGLRYLEHYEFRLVREALMEREVLWAMAPHIIWPMRFVLPFHKGGVRPAWLIRMGLFLYDHLGGRKLLPATKTLDLRRDPAGKPLKPLFSKAFEYSDGWVDDARLVVQCAGRCQPRRDDPLPHQGRLLQTRQGPLEGGSRGSSKRRAPQLHGQDPRQRIRSMGRPRAHRDLRAQRSTQCQAGSGQPYRGEKEVPGSSRLFFPESG